MMRILDLIDDIGEVARRTVSAVARLFRAGDSLLRLLFVLLPPYLIYRGDWLSLGALAFVMLVYCGMSAGPRRGGGTSPIERDDCDHAYRRRPIHQSWRH